MSVEVLRPACELAFAVARNGAEANEPIEPPASMRSFLYVDDLPRRAIAAAQQAIEENSDFRHRVAQRADERQIGRAGYLWLRRPSGWAQEFEELAAGEPGAEGLPAIDLATVDTTLGTGGGFDAVEGLNRGRTTEPIELVTGQPPAPDLDEPFRTDEPGDDQAGPGPRSAIGGRQGTDQGPGSGGRSIPSGHHGLAAVTDIDNADFEPAETPLDLRDNGVGDNVADDGSDEADALESELASLRGLVARLANEREIVVSSVPDLDPGAEDGIESYLPDATGDPGSLRSDLEAVQHELYLAQTDLNIVRQEREDAQRLQSEALKRQVQLEKELAAVREVRAELENQLSSSQARVISVEERFARIETQLSEADHERQVVKSQLETMTLERNQIRDERSALRVERDDLRGRLNDISEKTGGVDVAELVEANRLASVELADTARELATMIAQAEQFEEQVKALSLEVTTLKTERMDLRGRLGETETSLEGVTTQFEALRVDAERMASDLGTLRAERDNLQSQLAELQTSLSDMLADQAEGRQRNDADRRALNELRVERDVTLARLADVEEAEQEGKVRIEALASERDELLADRDELLDERGQVRAELAALTAEREELHQHVTTMEGQLGTTQTELQRERRQREELANRLLQLDEQAERLGTEQAALALERDDLVQAVERLESERASAEQFRRERDSLASELANARSEHRQEIEEVTRRLDAVAAETEDLRTAREEIEGQLSERGTELEAVRTELADAEAERDRLVAERDQSTAELEARRGAAESAETEMAELRLALEGARTAAEEAGAALEAKESELRAALDARSADTAEIEKLRTNLAEAMLRADEQVADKTQQLAEINEQLAVGTDQLAAMEERLAQADAQVAGADERLAEATKRVDDATGQLEETNRQLAEREEELAGRAGELAEREEELAEANRRLAEREEELAEANRRLAERDENLEDRDRQLTERDERLVDATRQVTESDLRAAGKESELETLRAELEELRASAADSAEAADRQASDQAEELAAARTDLDRVNTRLRQAEDEAGRLRDELAATRVELASSNAELEAQTTGSTPAMPPSVMADYEGEGHGAGDGDELDSMAAEVRSALRGPSVLDSLVEEATTAADDAVARQADAVVEDVGAGLEAPGEETIEETIEEVAEPFVASEAYADVEVGGPAGGGVDAAPSPTEEDRPTFRELSEVAGVGFDTGEESGRAGPDRDPLETAFPAAGREPAEEDELDLVSELIAQTVSSFSADEMAEYPMGEDDVDLSAELAQTSGGVPASEMSIEPPTSAPPSILGAPPQARPAEQPDLGARSSGGPKRLGIEIPGDIVGDEIAVARYVVSTPDVVLLVDGDSVAQLGWPKLPVPQQRDALVTYLADLSASSGAAPDVVFDGRIGDDDSLPASRAVRIRLSTPPTPPTAALEELVDAYPQQWPIALVTDDIDLATTAADRGAAVLNNGQLLDLFIAE